MLINKILWLKAYLFWELEPVPVKKKPGAGQKQTSFATLIALNRCELARGMQVQTWPIFNMWQCPRWSDDFASMTLHSQHNGYRYWTAVSG